MIADAANGTPKAAAIATKKPRDESAGTELLRVTTATSTPVPMEQEPVEEIEWSDDKTTARFTGNKLTTYLMELQPCSSTLVELDLSRGPGWKNYIETYPNITNTVVAMLCQLGLHQLKSLTLSGINMTDEHIKQIVAVYGPHLLTLAIDDNPGATGESLAALLKTCTQLTTLTLSIDNNSGHIRLRFYKGNYPAELLAESLRNRLSLSLPPSTYTQEDLNELASRYPELKEIVLPITNDSDLLRKVCLAWPNLTCVKSPIADLTNAEVLNRWASVTGNPSYHAIEHAAEDTTPPFTYTYGPSGSEEQSDQGLSRLAQVGASLGESRSEIIPKSKRESLLPVIGIDFLRGGVIVKEKNTSEALVSIAGKGTVNPIFHLEKPGDETISSAEHYLAETLARIKSKAKHPEVAEVMLIGSSYSQTFNRSTGTFLSLKTGAIQIFYENLCLKQEETEDNLQKEVEYRYDNTGKLSSLEVTLRSSSRFSFRIDSGRNISNITVTETRKILIEPIKGSFEDDIRVTTTQLSIAVENPSLIYELYMQMVNFSSRTDIPALHYNSYYEVLDAYWSDISKEKRWGLLFVALELNLFDLPTVKALLLKAVELKRCTKKEMDKWIQRHAIISLIKENVGDKKNEINRLCKEYMRHKKASQTDPFIQSCEIAIRLVGELGDRNDPMIEFKLATLLSSDAAMSDESIRASQEAFQKPVKPASRVSLVSILDGSRPAKDPSSTPTPGGGEK